MSAPSHVPKGKISKGIFKDEKVLTFLTLLQDVTRSFLTDGLYKMAQKQAAEHGGSVQLLQQYFTVGLDRIASWTENELKDEELRVTQLHPELPDLYHYAAVVMAQSFVKEIVSEVKLELPSFRSFLYCYYQTLAVQPYIRGLNYFNNWHLETQALLQDVVRYSLYNMVKPNLKYESGAVTTRDIVDARSDPLKALDVLTAEEVTPLDSVSQVDAQSYISHTSRASAKDIPGDSRSHTSRHSTTDTPVDARSHTSRHSTTDTPVDARSHTSRHSTHSRASRHSRVSALLHEKDSLDDARSILSKARSQKSKASRYSAASKASLHDNGTRSVMGAPSRHRRHRNDDDTRSTVESVISLNLSDAHVFDDSDSDDDTKVSRVSSRSSRSTRSTASSFHFF